MSSGLLFIFIMCLSNSGTFTELRTTSFIETILDKINKLRLRNLDNKIASLILI